MKENYVEALKLYGKDADMGNAEAKYKLGKILLKEGEKYLRESREQGNTAASAFIKENKIIMNNSFIFISKASSFERSRIVIRFAFGIAILSIRT